MKKIVVAVFGKDRPGIVCKVSSVLAEHGCNIEDISQTVLQGEFCGMFVVSPPSSITVESLKKILDDNLKGLDLLAFTKPLNTDENISPKKTEPFVIVSIGKDRVGLIAAMSCIMHEYGVNITNLKFINRTPAFPERTLTIYEVDIPVDIKLTEFTEKLKNRAKELDLDVSVQHKRIFEEICRI